MEKLAPFPHPRTAPHADNRCVVLYSHRVRLDWIGKKQIGGGVGVVSSRGEGHKEKESERGERRAEQRGSALQPLIRSEQGWRVVMRLDYNYDNEFWTKHVRVTCWPWWGIWGVGGGVRRGYLVQSEFCSEVRKKIRAAFAVSARICYSLAMVFSRYETHYSQCYSDNKKEVFAYTSSLTS